MVKRDFTIQIKNYSLVMKLALFTFIILSPVIEFKYIQGMNNLIIKILLLAIIIGMCFVDFQLALIATIAFLILIINLNNNILNMSYNNQQFDNFSNPLDAHFSSPIQIPKDVDQTQNIVCQNSSKTDINNDIISHYIDDKIKPYEVFISMMTSGTALEKAQGADM